MIGGVHKILSHAYPQLQQVLSESKLTSVDPIVSAAASLKLQETIQLEYHGKELHFQTEQVFDGELPSHSSIKCHCTGT